MNNDTTDWMIPDEIKNEFAFLAAEFRLKTNASVDDVIHFMAEVIKVYTKYLDTKEKIN